MLQRLLNMMDDTTSSMPMTFDGWNTYKTTLLFDGWDIETKWEFSLSVLAVAFFALIYQAMRFLIFVVEDTMHPPINSSYSTLGSMESGDRRGKNVANTGTEGYQRTSQLDPAGDLENPSCCTRGDETTPLSRAESPADEDSSMRYIWLRLLHSVLSGLNYGLALLLMLVAMNYNPNLFIALITGYAIGDFIFFARMRPSSNVDCH